MLHLTGCPACSHQAFQRLVYSLEPDELISPQRVPWPSVQPSHLDRFFTKSGHWGWWQDSVFHFPLCLLFHEDESRTPLQMLSLSGVLKTYPALWRTGLGWMACWDHNSFSQVYHKVVLSLVSHFIVLGLCCNWDVFGFCRSHYVLFSTEISFVFCSIL